MESSVVPDPYVVELERFQGPLDLLLHLIRKQDLDIFDIPIARITEQFLGAISGVDRLELERAGEFLEMAAILVRVKAQMLFPRREEEDEEDPRADLVRRLLEYEHFREAASLLERAEAERGRSFVRGYVEVRPPRPRAEVPLEMGWEEVWEAVCRLEDRHRKPDPGYRFATRPVRIEDKIAYVTEVLDREKRVEFRDLLLPWSNRMHAVVSLLACLELTKRSELRLHQNRPFSSLWIHTADQELAP